VRRLTRGVGRDRGGEQKQQFCDAAPACGDALVERPASPQDAAHECGNHQRSRELWSADPEAHPGKGSMLFARLGRVQMDRTRRARCSRQGDLSIVGQRRPAGLWDAHETRVVDLQSGWAQ